MMTPQEIETQLGNLSDFLAVHERRLAALEKAGANYPLGSTQWMQWVEDHLRQHAVKLAGLAMMAWPALQVLAPEWVKVLGLSDQTRHLVSLALMTVMALSTQVKKPDGRSPA